MFCSIVKRSLFIVAVINNRWAFKYKAKSPVNVLPTTVSSIKCLKNDNFNSVNYFLNVTPNIKNRCTSSTHTSFNTRRLIKSTTNDFQGSRNKYSGEVYMKIVTLVVLVKLLSFTFSLSIKCFFFIESS